MPSRLNLSGQCSVTGVLLLLGDNRIQLHPPVVVVKLLILKRSDFLNTCSQLSPARGMSTEGNSLFGNISRAQPVSATPHRRRDHISCGHLRGFGFLNQFCLPREAGTQGQVRFRRRDARFSVGMVLRCHSSARFPYRHLFILGFCLFLPTSKS